MESNNDHQEQSIKCGTKQFLQYVMPIFPLPVSNATGLDGSGGAAPVPGILKPVPAVVVVLHGLLDLGVRVHHEGPVLHHRWYNWHDQSLVQDLSMGPSDDWSCSP
jgi:hypothetical protein